MKKIISKSILLTMMVTVINFGFKIYLSYHISKENIGLFYTSIDIVSVASLLFAGYKDSMIQVFASNSFLKIKNYIFRQYTAMVLLLIPVLYFVFEENKDIYNLYSVIFFLLFFIVSQISNYYSYLNVAHRNYNSMLYEKSVKAIALIVSFPLLIEFYSMINALIIAYIVQFFLHIVYMKITSPHIYFIQSLENSKEVYRSFIKNYTLATMTSFLGSITVYTSAIVMFYLYANSDALAQYQVVVKSIFFALVAIFVHPLAAYTFPELSKFIADKNYGEVKLLDKKLKKYLFLFLLIMISFTFVTKFAVALVFPSEYNQSYKMLNILLPLLPFIAYTSFTINIIKGFDCFSLALWIRFLGSLLFFVSIALLYLFNIGANAIVYGLDLSFFGMFLLAYYFKSRILL